MTLMDDGFGQKCSFNINDKYEDDAAMDKITGKDLINKGAEEGPWFPSAIKHGNALLAEGMDFDEAVNAALVRAQPCRSTHAH